MSAQSPLVSTSFIHSVPLRIRQTKLVVLGRSGSGRTSVVNSLRGIPFQEEYGKGSPVTALPGPSSSSLLCSANMNLVVIDYNIPFCGFEECVADSNTLFLVVCDWWCEMNDLKRIFQRIVMHAPGAHVCLAINKSDIDPLTPMYDKAAHSFNQFALLCDNYVDVLRFSRNNIIPCSAKTGQGMKNIEHWLQTANSQLPAYSVYGCAWYKSLVEWIQSRRQKNNANSENWLQKHSSLDRAWYDGATRWIHSQQQIIRVEDVLCEALARGASKEEACGLFSALEQEGLALVAGKYACIDLAMFLSHIAHLTHDQIELIPPAIAEMLEELGKPTGKILARRRINDKRLCAYKILVSKDAFSSSSVDFPDSVFGSLLVVRLARILTITSADMHGCSWGFQDNTTTYATGTLCIEEGSISLDVDGITPWHFRFGVELCKLIVAILDSVVPGLRSCFALTQYLPSPCCHGMEWKLEVLRYSKSWTCSCGMMFLTSELMPCFMEQCAVDPTFVTQRYQMPGASGCSVFKADFLAAIAAAPIIQIQDRLAYEFSQLDLPDDFRTTLFDVCRQQGIKTPKDLKKSWFLLLRLLPDFPPAAKATLETWLFDETPSVQPHVATPDEQSILDRFASMQRAVQEQYVKEKRQLEAEKLAYQQKINKALLEATAADNTGILVHLIRSEGADVHADDDAALICAVEYRKTDALNCLLSAGANVHARNDMALREAAKDGNEEIVRILHAAGANVHAEDDEALRYAAFWGRLAVMRFLIDNGADIHAKNDEALRCAASGGRVCELDILLAAGANVHAVDDEALREAAGNNHMNIVEMLLAAGADVHARNDEALRRAFAARNTCLMDRLIQAGANVNVDNGILLHDAVSKHFSSIAYKLLQDGADVHAGEDAALRCAASHGFADIVDMLLSWHVDIHARDDEALRTSAEKGHINVVKALLAAGANVHARDNEALRIAALHSRTVIVRKLVAAGANVHANDDEALQSAVRAGCTEIVSCLIKGGADVNAKDGKALREAACWKKNDIVCLLVTAGANVNSLNDDTALRRAAYLDCFDMLNILPESEETRQDIEETRVYLRNAYKMTDVEFLKPLIPNEISRNSVMNAQQKLVDMLLTAVLYPWVVVDLNDAELARLWRDAGDIREPGPAFRLYLSMYQQWMSVMSQVAGQRIQQRNKPLNDIRREMDKRLENFFDLIVGLGPSVLSTLVDIAMVARFCMQASRAPIFTAQHQDMEDRRMTRIADVSVLTIDVLDGVLRECERVATMTDVRQTPNMVEMMDCNRKSLDMLRMSHTLFKSRIQKGARNNEKE